MLARVFPWTLTIMTAVTFGICSGENVAVGKPCTSSGETEDARGARKVVDGVADGAMENNYCWHGIGGAAQWWTVDLRAIYSIQRVVLHNRNAFQERLSNAVIEGFMADPHFPSAASACGVTPASVGQLITVECNSGATGRYVRVSGPPSMTICEVEIFGSKLGDIGPQNCTSAEILISRAERITDATSLGMTSTSRECIKLCFDQPECSVAGFNNATNTCTSSTKPVKTTADGTSTIYFVS